MTSKQANDRPGREKDHAFRAVEQEPTAGVPNLRRSIIAGVAALNRGEYTEVEDKDLDAYLDGLAAEAR
jgi:hypothetical protein